MRAHSGKGGTSNEPRYLLHHPQRFCRPFICELEEYYPTPSEKFYAVMNAAEDANNEEVLEILQWIEKQDLVKTFFPEQI